MIGRQYIVLGANSLVGREVLDLLTSRGDEVLAFTRKALPADTDRVKWRSLAELADVRFDGTVSAICVAHVWVIGEHISAMSQASVKRLVALSTTSVFTKQSSKDEREQEAWRLYDQSEREVREACEKKGIGWTILRPTLIYGRGRDKNISEIARMIARFGIFPLFGAACGKRQPISARDVAKAAVLAVDAPQSIGKTYNISGGETLAYREMIRRTFVAMGRRPRMPTVPLGLFKGLLRAMTLLPRFRHWTPDMAVRMNSDQDFDHSEAVRDFGFSPEPFVLTREDVGLG